MTRICPVCKEEEEDWDHYDYECKGVKEMNEEVAKSVGRTHAFSRNEWSLEEEEMEKKVMLNIAKARWIYHCERVKMDMKQRKRLNVKTLMNRLDRRMKIVATMMTAKAEAATTNAAATAATTTKTEAATTAAAEMKRRQQQQQQQQQQQLSLI